MKTTLNNGMTPKDIFNTRTASNSIKDFEGKILPVYGYCRGEDVDKATGEVMALGYIKTVDNAIIGFKSSVCIECLEDLDDFITDTGIDITTGEIKIKFIKGTAKSGREFYSFQMVD